MVNINEIVKDDLTKVSEMDSFKIMDLLDLDGEDSAEAVQEACKSYVRSDLGKKDRIKKTEYELMGMTNRGKKFTGTGVYLTDRSKDRTWLAKVIDVVPVHSRGWHPVDAK